MIWRIDSTRTQMRVLLVVLIPLVRRIDRVLRQPAKAKTCVTYVHWQMKAAQRRTSLKKCLKDLREYSIPLAVLLSEDGTRTSSRREIEIITESPIILTGEAPPRILPSEAQIAIKSMKFGTASDPILYQQTFFGLVAIGFM
ncbi:hypothetical protein RB195_019220 [Necator americanus]|uniref:Uncharacterized protein n=1 Tax=Necator americanus TaxID=51031 RepID=A0ABR1CD73_NECAM